MGKFFILKRAVQGELLKFKSKTFWEYELSHLNATKICPVIVSLTSYGFRVSEIVPFTILSILKQTIRPEKIILWLDSDNWNKTNIPPKLKDLQKAGVEIAFCKDLRSYKKLVPTLTFYGNAKPIITIDDDIYYSSNFIEEIYNYHLKYPNCIITENFCYPKFSSTNIAPYREWNEYHIVSDDTTLSKHLIFPQGFGGVLYPANSLHSDATNEDLFTMLAPHADDIWFYIMGILNKTPKQCVLSSKTKYYLIDLFRQKRTRDRLHDINVGEDQNDKQLSALCKYYNLSLKDYE